MIKDAERDGCQTFSGPLLRSGSPARALRGAAAKLRPTHKAGQPVANLNGPQPQATRRAMRGARIVRRAFFVLIFAVADPYRPFSTFPNVYYFINVVFSCDAAVRAAHAQRASGLRPCYDPLFSARASRARNKGTVIKHGHTSGLSAAPGWMNFAPLRCFAIDCFTKTLMCAQFKMWTGLLPCVQHLRCMLLPGVAAHLMIIEIR